jgi:dihydroorotate dehydrogenase (fumarate)
MIMEKLTTNYLGLKLKSPVIVSSSRLTSNLESLVKAEENGAGAVVLKSLFEEQIMFHINEFPSHDYPEADDYVASYSREHTVGAYLDLVKNAKNSLGIPVIPSINCFSSGAWIEFASRIQDAGADAIEINAFFLPLDRQLKATDSEQIYLDLVAKLMKKITIPVVLKIGFRFSNVLNLIDQLYARGVKGVVLFNRFYEPDIDINRIEIVPAQILSSSIEKRYVLRWIAMASAMGLNINISASTGVTNGEDVIKYLLAGADTVQVCSVLYQKGMPFLQEMNQQVSDWMTEKNFDSINEFRGMLNWKNTRKPVIFERTQFMKYFSSLD